MTKELANKELVKTVSEDLNLGEGI